MHYLSNYSRIIFHMNEQIPTTLLTTVIIVGFMVICVAYCLDIGATI